MTYQPELSAPHHSRKPPARPPAVVMNMFYTGLGIARSLGERGIRVIGLSAHRIYGNYTRYAEVRKAPDSRERPEELLQFLLDLGPKLRSPGVLFPTRDDDLVFLDRFRRELSRYYVPVLPEAEALDACLDKWQTYVCALKAGVPAPRSWKIENRQELLSVASDIAFPCVIKPLSSFHWRRNGNWERVGSRKAICVSDLDELYREYDTISPGEQRILLQEAIPGEDTRLAIAACHMGPHSELVAAFGARKVLQIPKGFGTGCIVETGENPEVIQLSLRLLKEMRLTGLAEVEFKWDSVRSEYKLIEINARPWDQHRLGYACGADLIYSAYLHFAGLPCPQPQNPHHRPCKWVAEDAFLFALLRSLWRRNRRFHSLRRLAAGRRIYGIWDIHDPAPFLAWALHAIRTGLTAALRQLTCTVQDRLRRPYRSEPNTQLKAMSK